MRTLNLRINFFWDDGDDMETFELTVPSNVSNAEILDVLKKEHEYLCEEDEEDVYGKTGRTPETLLNYPKYGCINTHGSLLPKYRG